MRGILLLTLGALLIWVGVHAGAEGEAAAAEPGTAGAAPPDDVDPGPTETTPTPEGAEPAGALVAEARLEEVEVDPPSAPQPPAPTPRPTRVEPEAAQEVDLGGPRADPVELAALLLEAWLDQDPAALEARLNHAERPLANDQRRVLAAFWQAVVGTPDSAAQTARDLEGREGVSSAELSFLRAAAEPARDRPIPAASSRRAPLALAMRMVLLEERADHAAREGSWALAARSRSDLIQLELGAPWSPHRAALADWAAALHQAQSRHRLHPDGEWPSVEVEVLEGEGLASVRQRVLREHEGLRVCVGLIREVNGVGKFIHPGDVLRIPTDVPNVLVDLDARLLVYRHGTEAVGAWSIGIGKEGNETPTGRFEVGEKIEDPSWRPIGGDQLPFGHPDNPLGTRWIAWFRDGNKTSYGVHGTWDPSGVGDRVSQGCIRMLNEHVETLFELLPVGCEVLVEP